MPLLDDKFWRDIQQGLTDAGNRGIVGGTLGAPVDLAAGVINAALMSGGYLGNKMGLLNAGQMPQPIENPVGGSEWLGQKMQDAGMVSADRNPVAETLAGLLGPGAINKGGQAVWAMEQNAAKPSLLNDAMRGQLGAIVYHGSPHSFDKFDMSKVGTGEGAQAYGHGMYFADQRGVAKSYQDALADWHPTGVKAAPGTAEDRAAAYVAGEIDGQASYPFTSALQKARRFLDDGDPQKNAIIKQIEQWHQSGTEFKKPGALYKVDLPDEHIAKMLDWDKPLSQQPQALEAVKKITGPNGQPEKWTGSEAWDAVRMMMDPHGKDWQGAAPAASKALRALGIPGIRYLDAGSRAGGKGSSNYVIFDDQLMKIVGTE